MNTGAPWPDLTEAEARVLGIQTKLHQWALAQRHGLVESRMRGNAHVRFGGAGRGNGRFERNTPRPGPTPTSPFAGGWLSEGCARRTSSTPLPALPGCRRRGDAARYEARVIRALSTDRHRPGWHDRSIHDLAFAERLAQVDGEWRRRISGTVLATFARSHADSEPDLVLRLLHIDDLDPALSRLPGRTRALVHQQVDRRGAGRRL